MKSAISLLLLLSLALTGCTIKPEPAHTSTPAFTALAPATRIPTNQPTITPTYQPTSTRTPRPTAQPTPVPTVWEIAAPPLGLVYEILAGPGKGTWIIDTNGQPQLLASYTDLLISPGQRLALYDDGEEIGLVDLKTQETFYLGLEKRANCWSPDSRYVYYSDWPDDLRERDLWELDIQTRARRNLSQTPDWIEMGTWILPANPNLIFFYVVPREDWDDFVDVEGSIGYLALVGLEGSGYSIISQDKLTSSPAFSPVGSSIIYTDKKGDWLYRLGQGSQPFPYENYSLDPNLHITYPSWSPDGRYLAAWSRLEDDLGYYTGLVLIDWEAGTSHLLTDYQSYYAFKILLELRWSSDSKRLLFKGIRLADGMQGWWMADTATGQTELIFELPDIMFVQELVLSPDGRQAALYNDGPPLGDYPGRTIEAGIWIFDFAEKTLVKLDLPPEAVPVGWW